MTRLVFYVNQYLRHDLQMSLSLYKISIITFLFRKPLNRLIISGLSVFWEQAKNSLKQKQVHELQTKDRQMQIILW